MKDLQHRDYRYLTPRELRGDRSVLRRCLLIGSCAIGSLPHHVQNNPEAVPIDFFNINHGGFLPDSAPTPLENYDFQIIHLPLRILITDKTFMRLGLIDEQSANGLLEQACLALDFCFGNVVRWSRESGLPAFFCNFVVPQRNPLGRFSAKYSINNVSYFVEKINFHLSELIDQENSVYLLDLDEISSTFGRKLAQDDFITCFAHGAFVSNFDAPLDQDRLETTTPVDVFYQNDTPFLLSALWEEAVAMFRTLKGLDTVKAVIVDLDDTLWRGVLAEQATLDSTATEGWPVGFAESLVYLKARGVILAIVSRNDHATVENIWREVYGDRITLCDFASVHIAWDFKVDGVARVLTDLNILPRNALFIDDNPAERDAIKRAFPEMRTLGSNPYILRRVMLWAPELQTPFITDEARRRTEMIQAQVKRETQRSTLTKEEFLSSISPKVSVFRVNEADEARFRRAFDLLNKTNQFNTSGRRWSPQEFGDFVRDHLLFAFAVEDIHTNYGLVGLFLICGNEILQAVMSCRVLGLSVEIGALSNIRNSISGPLFASIIETETNMPVRDLWERAGFEKDGNKYVLGQSLDIQCPKHVTVTRD